MAHVTSVVVMGVAVVTLVLIHLFLCVPLSMSIDYRFSTVYWKIRVLSMPSCYE